MASKIKLGRYRHSKSGNDYEFLGIAKHSESLERLALYKPLYKSSTNFWVRPVAMFLEKVVIDGKKVSRFQFLEKQKKSGYELETKVLDVKRNEIEKKIEELGGRKVLETRLKVVWYRKRGWGEGDDEWFLRIRNDGEGKNEVTWKAKSKKRGVARGHREINFVVDNTREIENLFLELGLERYAYQEKDRTSWLWEDVRLDLDHYPKMPAYLEIEGKSERQIEKAIEALKLEKHETSSEGERILIQKKYGLDWYEMKF